MSAGAESRPVDIFWVDRALAARLIAETGISAGALTVPRPEIEAIVSRSRRAGQAEELASLGGHRYCVVCGCTATNACLTTDTLGTWSACSWVDNAPICTACQPFIAEARS